MFKTNKTIIKMSNDMMGFELGLKISLSVTLPLWLDQADTEYIMYVITVKLCEDNFF